MMKKSPSIKGNKMKNENEKVSGVVEDIFATAVALDSASRVKNTVYCLRRKIFIKNFDNTILLQFDIPKYEKPFRNPVSFNAVDYDSNQFREEKGCIIFTSEVGGVKRVKTVSAPGSSPADVKAMFEKYPNLDECEISFHAKILEAIEKRLSHIEISVKDKAWKLTQRDIYSGARIELSYIKTGFGRGAEKLNVDVGPVAMRTSDFIALFSFNDRLTFGFDTKCKEYMSVTGKKHSLKGRVAFCLFDELGDITPIKT